MAGVAAGEAPPPPAASREVTAAEVDGHRISVAALEERCLPAFATHELQLLAGRHQVLRALIEDLVVRQEAGRRGTSVPALLEAVKDVPGIEVTDEEIRRFYEENEEQFPAGVEAARETIRTILRDQKAAGRVQEFTRDLVAAARVVVYLPPRPARVDPIRPGARRPVVPLPPAPPGPPGIVAEVNGVPVPASELEARRPGAEQARERVRHQIRGWTLGKMVDEVLVEQEASRRGMTPAALREAVTSHVVVPEAEVAAAERLRRGRARKVWDEFVAGLRSKATLVVHLGGPDGAPVQLYPH